MAIITSAGRLYFQAGVTVDPVEHDGTFVVEVHPEDELAEPYRRGYKVEPQKVTQLEDGWLDKCSAVIVQNTSPHAMALTSNSVPSGIYIPGNAEIRLFAETVRGLGVAFIDKDVDEVAVAKLILFPG